MGKWQPGSGPPFGNSPPTLQVPFLKRPAFADIVTEWQSGHGWTSAGTGTNNLNDTSDYVLGTQSVQMVTNGAGATDQVRIVGGTAFDLTGKIPVLVFKVDDWTKFQGMNIYMGDTSFANFYLDGMSDNLSGGSTANEGLMAFDNEWHAYVVPWTQVSVGAGTPSRTNVTDWQISISDRSTGSVTLQINGLYLIDDASTLFPNGVATITFDDSYASTYTQARPIMDKYGYAASVYPIVDGIGAAGGMTLDQLHDLELINGWEVCGHCFTTALHDSWSTAAPSTNVATADIIAVKEWLLQQSFAGSNHYAFPGGKRTASIESVVKEYFSSARLVNDTSYETVTPWNAYRLRPKGYAGSATATGTLTGYIDAAYANSAWLFLSFHELVASGATGDQYTIANFTTVVDYLNTKGIPVQTVGQVLRQLNTTI